MEITKLKQRVKKLERRNKLKVSKLKKLKRFGAAQRVDTSEDTVMDDVSKQGGIIANMDVDEDITLKDVPVVSKEVEVEKTAEIKENDVADITKEVDVDAEIEESADDDEVEPAELQKVVEVVTTAKLMTEVVTAAKKTKEQIEEEDSKELKKESESQAEKAAKKQKLDNEVSLLSNFDREDLKMIWQLVKERFASSKPKNFSDDFLLTTLTYMFEKPDVQAQVWKNQRSVHGLAKSNVDATSLKLKLFKDAAAVAHAK
nr:hypothetical protein [Tanacetum cinerariifolium]